MNKEVKKIVVLFSLILTVFIGGYFLKTARALNNANVNKLYLRDNFDYDYKANKETDFDLNLYFVDENDNSFTYEDITFSLGSQENEDTAYGFGYEPLEAGLVVGKDFIKEMNLETITLKTGEAYEFDHALVYVNNAWQTFSSTSNHWDIWCQGASSESEADYGWRGRYGNNINYTITSDTEFKFVYKLVRYGISETVPSLGSDSGISFKMFNYYGDNTQTGVNDNGLWGYFTFRSIADIINNDIDEDAFTENRAKVLPNLENGYPVFDCRGHCTNKSLGYLFGADKNGDNLDTKGVNKYISNNTPLQKKTINNVEYYYYSSNENAVDYDTVNNRFMVRNYVERSINMLGYEHETSRYEFLPFNYKTSTSNYKNEDNLEYNFPNNEVDHWFGMTMEFSFYMPKNGMINGNDMIFEFSGDDDVYVFIDDVLVLDLGGTHGAVDGNINFKTGNVEAYLNWQGVVGEKETTNIYEAFTKGSKTDSTLWNNNNTTFEDYSLHTLKFFYLERGASVANCKIKFNMPVLPSGTLAVQKVLEGDDKYNEDYEFTLYDTTTNSPVSNAKYLVDSVEYTTSNEGKFTLKNDEVAVFNLINEHTYYVEETNAGQYAESYKCTLNNLDCTNINKTDEFIIKPESFYKAVFTNKPKTYDLELIKLVNGKETTKDFKFILSLKDKEDKIVNLKNENTSLDYEIDNETGNIIFDLKHNENIIIKDILIDTIVNIKEVLEEDYQVNFKSEDLLLSDTNEYEFKMDSDKKITVYNTEEITLPKTGGQGTHIYYIFGLLMILISSILYLKIFYKRN